ncbi:MAG: hypothetical protein ACM3U1_03980 [Chloroflexota bacterium]
MMSEHILSLVEGYGKGKIRALRQAFSLQTFTCCETGHQIYDRDRKANRSETN